MFRHILFVGAALLSASISFAQIPTSPSLLPGAPVQPQHGAQFQQQSPSLPSVQTPTIVNLQMHCKLEPST